MGFRDDGTALRSRLDALERKARDAGRLEERCRELTDENRRLKRRVAELSALVEPVRPIVAPRPIRPLPAPGSDLALSFSWQDYHGVEHHETLVGKVIQIGRLATSHLRIQGASRKHALIKVSKRAAVIIDQGSEKGTLVNGRKVKKASLKDGDRLQLGDVEVIVGVGR
ncbi:MAG: FHA domain-containing protein [Polyangiales bacterium]